MVQKFEAEFATDPEAVIAELRTLRAQNQDVTKYTEEFNAKIAKLAVTTSGVKEHLKILYMEGLPWKVKDQLLRDRTTKTLDLSGIQAEAKRQQNVTAYLNKGSNWNK